MDRLRTFFRAAYPLSLGLIFGFGLNFMVAGLRATPTGPRAEISTPATSSTVSGLVSIQAVANDEGVVSIQFKYDGQNLGQTITEGACAIDWSTAPVANGAHTLTVVSENDLGDVMTSSPVTVTVANASSIPPPAGTPTPTPTPTSTPMPTSTPSPTITPAPAGCSGVAPASNWTCSGGNWLPPGYLTTASVAPPSLPSLPSLVSPTSCPGNPPAPDWICAAGNWVPSGYPSPAAGTPQPTASPSPTATPTPTPTPSVSTAGCPGVAPAPGWTCVGGNWLPGGYPGASTPAVSPTPTATPTPTSSPSVGIAGCTTPDPFSILGGGTCVNGNWYPPGMAGPPASTPPLPTTPSSVPPAAPGVCAGADPFEGIPGLIGFCTNGDWRPAAALVGQGIVRYLQTNVGPMFMMEDALGILHELSSPLPLVMQQDDLVVWMRARRRTDLPSVLGLTEVLELVEIQLSGASQ